VAASPERQREIADFFADHERDVRRSVAYRVRQLPLPRSRMPVRRRGRSSVPIRRGSQGNRPRMIGDRGAARGVAALPSRTRGNASQIPDATLVMNPGAGHESNLEHPEPLNDAVREFCRARRARPA
jgi:pimeloyl-ACP methyl ester carboxylesterase